MATKRIALIILGVLFIVAGAGSAYTGMVKQEAAQEWKEQETAESEYCYHVVNKSKLPENFSEMKEEEGNEVEVMKAKHEARERKCDTITPSKSRNPYSGGGNDMIFGTVLTLLGGVLVYKGTQD